MVREGVFEVYQPFAVGADDFNGLLCILIAVGIDEKAGRVVYLIQAFDDDAGFFKIDFIGIGEPVVYGFPFVEDHLVDVHGVFIEVEQGFIVIAVEGGANEFAGGFFGVFGFSEGGVVVAGGEEGTDGEGQYNVFHCVFYFGDKCIDLTRIGTNEGEFGQMVCAPAALFYETDLTTMDTKGFHNGHNGLLFVFPLRGTMGFALQTIMHLL